MNLKIHAEFVDFCHSLQLTFYREVEVSRGNFIYHVAKPVELEFEPQPHGTIIVPTLRLEGRETGKLITDALRNAGHKPDEDAKLQGILEATKYHLEDMRSLARVGGHNWQSIELEKGKG